MKTLHFTYVFRYTTKGGAYRYGLMKEATVNVGDIYLRGITNPPKRLKLTIEA